VTYEATVESAAVAAAYDPDDLRNIRQNSFWNALQQIVSMVGGSVFAVVLAWVLPLREYGVYSYATALCYVGIAITGPGLGGLGIKYIVAQGVRRASSVATILLVREGFSIAAFLILGAVSLTSRDRLTIIATLVALTSLFFRALDAPELWYVAHMRSRRPAEIRIISVAIMLVVRVFSLLALPNLWVFIGIYVAEAALTSLWILWRFWFDPDTPGMTRPARADVRSLVRDSSPLALSTIAMQVNLRADVVIVQALLGSVSVGVYSLAARAGELAYFLPSVIMYSTLPVLLRALEDSRRSGLDTRYRRMLQIAYDRTFLSGIAVAAVVTAICLSPVRHLVNSGLRPAFGVLAIYIWASPFVFMSAVYSKWIVAEGYFWSALTRQVVGALTNIALVLVLVRCWGLYGAALATCVSYAVAFYFVCFIGKQSRTQAYCMTRALLSPVTVPARLVASAFWRARGRGQTGGGDISDDSEDLRL
jgi:O-antigen/teichoic acid export membrane protein